MKKFSSLLAVLVIAFVIGVQPAEAAYLSEYDQYVEVSSEEARYLADLMGLQGLPLGDQTASKSFEMQETAIKLIENQLGIEIDHYYIWLTVNGQPVLAIDPPVPMF